MGTFLVAGAILIMVLAFMFWDRRPKLVAGRYTWIVRLLEEDNITKTFVVITKDNSVEEVKERTVYLVEKTTAMTIIPVNFDYAGVSTMPIEERKGYFEAGQIEGDNPQSYIDDDRR